MYNNYEEKVHNRSRKAPSDPIDHTMGTRGRCEGNSKKGTTTQASEGTAILRETRPTPASLLGADKTRTAIASEAKKCCGLIIECCGLIIASQVLLISHGVCHLIDSHDLRERLPRSQGTGSQASKPEKVDLHPARIKGSACSALGAGQLLLSFYHPPVPAHSQCAHPRCIRLQEQHGTMISRLASEAQKESKNFEHRTCKFKIANRSSISKPTCKFGNIETKFKT